MEPRRPNLVAFVVATAIASFAAIGPVATPAAHGQASVTAAQRDAPPDMARLLAHVPSRSPVVVAVDVDRALAALDAIMPGTDGGFAAALREYFRSVFTDEVGELPVDLAATRAFAVGVDFAAQSLVFVTEPGVLVGSPPPRGAAAPLDADAWYAVRDGLVHIGMGALFDEAPDSGGGFDRTAVWPAGWDGAPSDPVGWGYFADAQPIHEMEQEAAREIPGFPAHAGVLRFAFAVGADSEAFVALETLDPATPSVWLGAVQAATEDGVARWRAELPDGLHALADYAELLRRGAWSRWTLDESGNTTRVTLAPAACGGLGQQFAGLGLLAVTAWRSLEAAPLSPGSWTPSTFVGADGCGPLPGETAALPEALARVAGAEPPPGPAALALIDHGALVRELLPTAGATMPFAASEEEISTALSPRDFGLASFADASRAALAVQGEGDPRFVAVLSPGLAALADDETSPAYTLDSGEAVYAVGGALPPPDTWPTESEWTAAAEAVPEAALAAVLFDAPLIAEMLEELPSFLRGGEAVQFVQSARMAILTVDEADRPVVRLLVEPGEEVRASAAQENFIALLDRTVATAEETGRAQPLFAARVARSVFDGVEFRAVRAGVVDIDLPTIPLGYLVGAFGAVGLQSGVATAEPETMPSPTF